MLNISQVRYKDDLPFVLHEVSCIFPGGKKIGIVGRTGSGKSTLIQALFRLIEPTGGKIIIDNVDVSAIGLHDLRSRLSIIPQDTTLFEGTIRMNLDPLEERPDHEIWEVCMPWSHLCYLCVKPVVLLMEENSFLSGTREVPARRCHSFERRKTGQSRYVSISCR